ncbi:MAG: hypothetical protein ACE5FF_04660, partial [Saprospiraceae bacterium]
FIELHQLVPAFAFRYLEKNRAVLDSMGLEGYVRDFKVGDKLLGEFLKYAIRHGSQRNARQWRKIKSDVALMLKAGIARDMWSGKGYFMVLNATDPAVTEARRLMKEDHPAPLMAN